MIKPFIAANWKMHKTVSESVYFAKQLSAEFAEVNDRDIIIAPSYTALYPVAEELKESSVHLSAQNMHWDEKGAFTGEVSAGMLVDAGCYYVILGHSERRTLFGEKDSDINKKIKTALNFGLKPIFCIGETLDERSSQKTFEVIERQIRKGLNNILSDDIRRIVIAYEPVWAIGTGTTATDEQAEEAHRYIREMIADLFGENAGADIRIIYGGSVNQENIGGFMNQPNINGALVGGASLDFESFASIINF
ncbi:MAG: triose-phosphate isomerase [Deltaproteobacteria bacterium]|nr:triose-phosphate isomerase [Deltaproteobacteria bacterium]